MRVRILRRPGKGMQGYDFGKLHDLFSQPVTYKGALSPGGTSLPCARTLRRCVFDIPPLLPSGLTCP